MILTNAVIHTSDDERPVADTVVVEDGRIAFVGTRAVWQQTAEDVEIDLGGRVIVPGLIDAHTHPGMVARSGWHVRLPRTRDLDELLAFIAEYAQTHPRDEMPFLYFEYYDRAVFGDAEPTKGLLDAVVSDRPVLCQDFSEHEHWVNSRMLELMGITKETPDPVPGLEMFVRDADGEPTGLLREMVHLRFLDVMYGRLGWHPPEQITPERIAPFFRFMTANGVTAVFEALVEGEDTARAVAELDDRDALCLTYEGAVRFRRRGDLDAAIAMLADFDSRHGRRRVRFRTLKLFLDGTNESGNGAVLSPLVEGDPARALGEIGMDAAELADCFDRCNEAGVDMHIHLVGDRAFRIACDAVEAARSRCDAEGIPWAMQVTFAHCELVDPADWRAPRNSASSSTGPPTGREAISERVRATTSATSAGTGCTASQRSPRPARRSPSAATW
ncbi:MAG TPA: amidohydrolase family protein [Microbacterium sp.]|nr:amidohydrolase family protein [Microbacterium sp.]